MRTYQGHFPGTDRPLAVAQIDHRDAKLIGEIAKSVKETLLFSGNAYFREIHFIKGEDSDFDFRQRIQFAVVKKPPPKRGRVYIRVSFRETIPTQQYNGETL